MGYEAKGTEHAEVYACCSTSSLFIYRMLSLHSLNSSVDQRGGYIKAFPPSSKLSGVKMDLTVFYLLEERFRKFLNLYNNFMKEEVFPLYCIIS